MSLTVRYCVPPAPPPVGRLIVNEDAGHRVTELVAVVVGADTWDGDTVAVLGAVLLAVADRVTVTVLEAGAGLVVVPGLSLGDGEPLDEQPVSAITADRTKPVHSVFMIEI